MKKLCAIAVTVLSCGIAAFHLLLPIAVERALASLSLPQAPGLRFTGRVERVGLFRTILTGVECRTATSRLAAAELVVVRHHPADLWKGMVTGVRISGLRLQAERLGNGTLALPGWPERAGQDPAESDRQDNRTAPPLPPVTFLEIRGMVAVRHANAATTPFFFRLSLENRRPEKAYATLAATTGQSSLDIQAALCRDQLRLWGKARLAAPDAAPWLPPLPFRPAGHLDLSGYAKAAWPAATLLAARLECNGRNLRLRLPDSTAILASVRGKVRFASRTPVSGQGQDLLAGGTVQIHAVQAAGRHIDVDGGTFSITASAAPGGKWRATVAHAGREPLLLRTPPGASLSLGRPEATCQGLANSAWRCLARTTPILAAWEGKELRLQAPLEIRAEGKDRRRPPDWRATLAGGFTAILPPLQPLAGSLEFTAQPRPQSGGHTTFSLTMDGRSPASISLSARGSAGNGEIDISGTIPELSFSDLPLTSILATANAADPLLLSGRIEGSFQAHGTLQAVQAEAELRLADGRVRLAGRGLTIEGIAGEMPFHAGPAFSSRPAEIRFSLARMGRYRIGPGRIKVQLLTTPLEAVIDRAEGAWVGGTVRVDGLRLRPGMRDIDIAFTCDRLRVAELLRQFGIDRVTGEGTVNGQIPLAYRDKRVVLGNGFLYSTPGKGGVIRMAEIDDLLAGAARAGSDRFMQLDFAQAVLRKFRYQWLRIALADDNGDVRLSLEMLGRPEDPVPFRYDERLGVFRRIEAEGDAGISRPVRLDVNFRIPFNELLGYGTTMQKVLDLAR